MARTEARIRCAVWRNRDFTSLPLEAQGLYWMLLSQPDISLAGVVPYNPNKWGHLCGGDVDTPLQVLEAGGFVMPDPTTGELWIRTFTKHDGVLDGEKTRSGMWSAWHNILSATIRASFVDHLADNHVAEGLERGWVTQGDIEDADSEAQIEAENGVSDGVSQPGLDGVSDGVSLARAESASASASASETTPVGNGKPFVSRLADELREDHGFDPEERQSWSKAFHDLLAFALEHLPDERHHSTAMGVIFGYAERSKVRVTTEARNHTARLVATHPPLKVLDAWDQAIQWGAGLNGEHAKDALALSKYAAAVLSGKARR